MTIPDDAARSIVGAPPAIPLGTVTLNLPSLAEANRLTLLAVERRIDELRAERLQINAEVKMLTATKVALEAAARHFDKQPVSDSLPLDEAPQTGNGDAAGDGDTLVG